MALNLSGKKFGELTVIEKSNINPEKRINEITKKQRNDIVK